MKFAFTVERGTGINLIRACSDREIIVRDHSIRSSVILSADKIQLDWPPQHAHALAPEHFTAALALEPEVILLGTGAQQIFPEPEILAGVYAAGVGIEVMTTAAACRTYNILLQEGRRVAAALIIEPQASS